LPSYRYIAVHPSKANRGEIWTGTIAHFTVKLTLRVEECAAAELSAAHPQVSRDLIGIGEVCVRRFECNKRQALVETV
jgi:hypothetical protein